MFKIIMWGDHYVGGDIDGGGSRWGGSNVRGAYEVWGVQEGGDGPLPRRGGYLTARYFL